MNADLLSPFIVTTRLPTYNYPEVPGNHRAGNSVVVSSLKYKFASFKDCNTKLAHNIDHVKDSNLLKRGHYECMGLLVGGSRWVEERCRVLSTYMFSISPPHN